MLVFLIPCDAKLADEALACCWILADSEGTPEAMVLRCTREGIADDAVLVTGRIDAARTVQVRENMWNICWREDPLEIVMLRDSAVHMRRCVGACFDTPPDEIFHRADQRDPRHVASCASKASVMTLCRGHGCRMEYVMELEQLLLEL